MQEEKKEKLDDVLYDQYFLDYVKKVESKNVCLNKAQPVKEKPKNGYTHVIGWGHNIKPSDPLMNKTISNLEAEQILREDLKRAQNIAISEFDKQRGFGHYSNLHPRKKQMLIDFAYNMGAGGLSQYTNFMKALDTNDFETACRHYKRNYEIKKGVYGELKDRNKTFYKTFLEDGQAFKESFKYDVRYKEDGSERDRIKKDAIAESEFQLRNQEQIYQDLKQEQANKERQIQNTKNQQKEWEQDIIKCQEEEQKLALELQQKIEEMKQKEQLLQLAKIELEKSVEQNKELETKELQKQAEIAQKMLEIQQINKENEELKAQLEKLNEEIQTLKAEIERLQAQIEEIKIQISIEEEQIEQLKEEIQELEAEIQKDEAEEKCEIQKKEHHEQNLNNLLGQIKSLESQKQNKKSRLDWAEAALSSLGNFLDSMVSFFETLISLLKGEIENDEQNLQSLREKEKEEELKKINCIERAKQLRKDIEEKQGMLQKTKKSLEQKEQELQNKIQQKTNLESQLLQKQQQLEVALKKMQDLTLIIILVGEIQLLSQKLSFFKNLLSDAPILKY